MRPRWRRHDDGRLLRLPRRRDLLARSGRTAGETGLLPDWRRRRRAGLPALREAAGRRARRVPARAPRRPVARRRAGRGPRGRNAPAVPVGRRLDRRQVRGARGPDRRRPRGGRHRGTDRGTRRRGQHGRRRGPARDRPVLLHASPGGRVRAVRTRPRGSGAPRLRLLRPADRSRGPRVSADELTPATGGCPPQALELLQTGEVEVLGRMPWSSNATLLVEVRSDGDCARAVYKPRRGERPLWDFPGGLDRREVAAYELSEWLGGGIVPETVLRDDDSLPFGAGSLQRFVQFDVESHHFTLIEDEGRHAGLRTVCCFDLVANSADRKGGHCLAGEGPPPALEPLLDHGERKALVRRARAVVRRASFPVDHTGRRYPWPLV